MGTATAVDEGATRHQRVTSEQLRSWALAPGIPLVLAALFSLPRLGSRSMWLDEAYTVGATNQLVDTWQETGGTQALYYLVVWPFSRVSIDPVWMRLPSALLALVAVVIVYEVGRRIGGRTMGTLAAGGLALSWGFARYAIEARGYMLSLVLVSLSWLALIEIVRESSSADASVSENRSGAATRRWWPLFIVATLLAPLAHGLAVLHFVAQVGALAFAPVPRVWVRRVVAVAVGLAVELGGLALLGASDVGDWVDPLNIRQVRSMAALMSGFGVTGGVLLLGATVAAVQAVRAYMRTQNVENWVRLVPIFWAVGAPTMVIAISLVRPYAAGRYIFAALPGFILLMAALVASLSSRRAALIGAGLVAALLVSDQVKVTTVQIENWEGMTACLAANAVDGDRVMTAAAHRSALDYYWPKDEAAPPLEPLYPTDSLGEVRRLYAMSDLGAKQLLLTDTSQPVWYIERGAFGEGVVASFSFDEEISSRYVVTDGWEFRGGLLLVRLDPIDEVRQRDLASCDSGEPL
jgi:hypothetical protein